MILTTLDRISMIQPWFGTGDRETGSASQPLQLLSTTRYPRPKNPA
jgi:hypothetical protein